MLYELTYMDCKYFENANPIKITKRLNIPGVKCSICGETWANMGSRTLKELPIDSDFTRKLQKESCVTLERLLELKKEFEEINNIKICTPILPGMYINPLTVKILKPLQPGFVFPWSPGITFLTEEVAKVFRDNNISGCALYPVLPAKGKISTSTKLFELVPTNEVEIVTLSKKYIPDLITCNGCGRPQIGKPLCSGSIKVDSESWNGSDVCTIKYCWGYTLVSEKVKNILKENAFSNYQLNPIEIV